VLTQRKTEDPIGTDSKDARQVIFPMAAVAIWLEMFRAIVEGIGRLRLPTAFPGLRPLDGNR